MDILSILQINIYGLILRDWLVGLGIFLGTVLLLQIIKRLLLQQTDRMRSNGSRGQDGLISTILRSTSFVWILALGIGIASIIVPPPERAVAFTQTALKVVFFVQVALWANALISYTINRRTRAELETSPATVTSINMIGMVLRVLLWTVVALLILENITGIEVNSLIASLGIAGVAVALAVQNLLGDLFASVSIAMDQPFVIGDFIIVDDLAGTVENIGLKSTRIRSLTGEQLVFSNSDLLSSRIRNYKRMARRRMLIYINIPYGTEEEKVKVVPELITEVVKRTPDITFERAHLMAFAEYSLRYEVVCYVETADYMVYMDRQQEIILGIYRKFAELGIEFAFPLQGVTIKEEGDGAAEKKLDTA